MVEFKEVSAFKNGIGISLLKNRYEVKKHWYIIN